VSVLAPFDYARLIMAAAIGLVFFGEMPTFADFVGAAIITTVCVWISTVARDNRVREAS
jgi:drug/metabolite transporter (DMT)-like permease